MNFSDLILKKFRDYCSEHQLLQPRQLILLAVSGGVDSVVLCKLFALSGQPFGIAHCNFQLRGRASDEDQLFTRQLAITYQVPFFTETFNTLEHAAIQKISVEMAARELRYSWLENIRKSHGFHAIATAHHRDDNVETVLLHLTKGTGLAGLHGMHPRREHIIRPMLALSKTEITEFARQHQLPFREDASNRDSVFQRNLLRNEVIPLLEKINPAFKESFAASIQKFRDAESIYKKGLEYYRKKLITQRGPDYYIPIKLLLQFEGIKTILYELLKDYGFNEKEVAQIHSRMREGSGQQYFSESHRVIQYRDFLILTCREPQPSNIVLVENIKKPVRLPDGGMLKFHLLKGAHISDTPPEIALLDHSKLQFPLVIRRWRQGDYFYPFGMQRKKKKLSDFFTDNKLSQLDKERAWIVESDKRIVWVVGYRIDDRFRVAATTPETLKIRYLKGKD